jgi:hypothetical protein
MKKAKPKQYGLEHSAFDQDQKGLNEWIGGDDD